MAVRPTALLLAAAAFLVSGCTDGEVESPRQEASAAPSSDRQGLTASLDVAPSVTGNEVTTLLLTVKDDRGGGPGYVVDFGDGTTDALALAVASCPKPLTPAPTEDAARLKIDTTITFKHTFAKPGTYEVTAMVISRPQCGEAPEESVTVTRTVAR